MRTSRILINVQMILLLNFIQSIKPEILTPAVEFSIPYNAINDPNEPFTPLVHANGYTLLVWVDSNFKPMVTQKFCSQHVVAVPLDSNSKYVAYNDGHHRYSIGVDDKGFIHVAGDMHGYPGGPNNNSYLPDEYKNQTVMYWISNAANDVTKGFTFSGGAKASTRIPGFSWNTGHFFNDKKNVLYYTSMVRGVYNANQRLTGEMAVGLYKYNSDTRTWASIGAQPPKDPSHPAGTQYFDVFFWEKGGWGNSAGQPQWFNNYWPSFQFDNNNTLHFCAAANIDVNIQGPSVVVYAKLLDGPNQKWKKADGKDISGFPLRGIKTQVNAADTVVDISPKTLSTQPTVAADVNGNPIVAVPISWDVPTLWYRYNKNSWANDLSNSRQLAGNKVAFGSDGMNTLINDIDIRRYSPDYQYSAQYRLDKYLPNEQLSNFICLDNSLQNGNEVYGLSRSKSLNRINVLKLNFLKTKLPCSWTFNDFGNDIKLGGISDLQNETFTLRSAGSGISNKSDSFHFAYRGLGGETTIIARIASQNIINGINGSADGIMMRESLALDSKFVYIGIGVNKNTSLITRKDTSANALVINQNANNGNLWLKITRLGNVFTCYLSNNGFAWNQYGQPQTINMAGSYYGGLVSYSAHLNEIHYATFDNVAVYDKNSYDNISGPSRLQ